MLHSASNLARRSRMGAPVRDRCAVREVAYRSGWSTNSETLAGAGLEPNETTRSGAASPNARRPRPRCYGCFLDLPCPGPAPTPYPRPVQAGILAKRSVPRRALHPGLGAIAVDLRL